MALRGGLTLMLALAATGLALIGLRHWNVLDVPNERSSHDRPTLRGGGLGVIAVVAPGVLLTPALNGGVGTELLIVGLGFAVIGFIDDIRGLHPLLRLPAQFLPALACLPLLLVGLDGPMLWVAFLFVLVGLWLVAFVNAFNFMDGINGLSVGQVLVAGAAWWVVGDVRHLEWLTAVAVISMAAAAGFAPFNFPRARVFLGDVGSYFFGGLLGAAAVAGLRAHVPAEAMLAPLAVYLADTASTLVRRIARGERWYKPHREHVYQRLSSDLGWSCTKVTLSLVAVMALCAGLGGLSLTGSTGVRVGADLVLALVVVGYVAAPSLLARRRSLQPAFA
jgi:UDP-N-acetylmuramyl pentapeptide phosphotransferase/UDP-N-acetylglucosamine-1-phosphate transferase